MPPLINTARHSSTLPPFFTMARVEVETHLPRLYLAGMILIYWKVPSGKFHIAIESNVATEIVDLPTINW